LTRGGRSLSLSPCDPQQREKAAIGWRDGRTTAAKASLPQHAQAATTPKLDKDRERERETQRKRERANEAIKGSYSKTQRWLLVRDASTGRLDQGFES